MYDFERMTVEEFFAWHQTVEGRYELVDGRIVPHPDYVTPQGLAAPANDHGAIISNLDAAFRAQLKAACRVYVGAGAKVNRVNANIPDLSVSCDPEDRGRMALENPRFVCEVLSPKTRRADMTRKVAEYLSIASLEAYVIVDGERRTVTVHRPDAGPQTWDDTSVVPLTDDVTLIVGELLA
ncbi:MAG: Uma2 family endonuclease [Candidatus Eremiobacteraeota bacterium]|nr:Uma2 family endonuclease [Candidatus Eremiobacteraeota bacterium]